MTTLYRSSTVLGDILVNCSSFDQFIKAIFDLLLEHAVRLAPPASSNGVRHYVFEEAPISEDTIGTFFIFKQNNHFYTISDSSERHHRATRMQKSTTDQNNVSILFRWTHHAVASEAFFYKYGTKLPTERFRLQSLSIVCAICF